MSCGFTTLHGVIRLKIYIDFFFNSLCPIVLLFIELTCLATNVLKAMNSVRISNLLFITDLCLLLFNLLSWNGGWGRNILYVDESYLMNTVQIISFRIYTFNFSASFIGCNGIFLMSKSKFLQIPLHIIST